MNPYEWRIDYIEKLAKSAAPAHEVTTLRAHVDRLEYTIRQLNTAVSTLSHEVEAQQWKMSQIEEQVGAKK